MSYCIIGTHTGIGKTVFSSILCRATHYDYWKPVQAGDLNNSDSMNVKRWVGGDPILIHPERYQLSHAVSPHRAAELDGLSMSLEDFDLPVNHNLVVETAGGLMSPINTGLLNIDLVRKLGLPLILVSGNYLGSINHTILTLEVLKSANLKLIGVVFSGEPNESSEKFILQHTESTCLFHLGKMDKVDEFEVKLQSERLIKENPFWK